MYWQDRKAGIAYADCTVQHCAWSANSQYACCQQSVRLLLQVSISGTILKVDELANSLQACLDSGAKKVLLPISSAVDLGTVPPELVGSFNLIFYSSAEDAVFKALGVE